MEVRTQIFSPFGSKPRSHRTFGAIAPECKTPHPGLKNTRPPRQKCPSPHPEIFLAIASNSPRVGVEKN